MLQDTEKTIKSKKNPSHIIANRPAGHAIIVLLIPDGDNSRM
jgi:hypothetical protein